MKVTPSFENCLSCGQLGNGKSFQTQHIWAPLYWIVCSLASLLDGGRVCTQHYLLSTPALWAKGPVACLHSGASGGFRKSGREVRV